MDQAGCFENTQAFAALGQGRVVRKPCGRLSGHGSSLEERGERSLEPSSFCLAGAKAACLRTILPEPFKRFSPTPSLIPFRHEFRNASNPDSSLKEGSQAFLSQE
jgi:hypothetical protein